MTQNELFSSGSTNSPDDPAAGSPGASARTCGRCGQPLVRRPGESEKKFQARKTCGCLADSRGLAPGEKTRWQSAYGGGWIGDAQYLAEEMCRRKARKDGVELPLRFWDGPPWKQFFLMQLRFANELLKRHSVDAILFGLRHPKGKTAFSLRASWLPELFGLYRPPDPSAVPEAAEVPQEKVDCPPQFKECPPARPRGLLSRLREDSDGEEGRARTN